MGATGGVAVYPGCGGMSDGQENCRETVSTAKTSKPGNSRKAGRWCEAEPQGGTGCRRGAGSREEPGRRSAEAPRGGPASPPGAARPRQALPPRRGAAAAAVAAATWPRASICAAAGPCRSEAPTWGPARGLKTTRRESRTHQPAQPCHLQSGNPACELAPALRHFRHELSQPRAETSSVCAGENFLHLQRIAECLGGRLDSVYTDSPA